MLAGLVLGGCQTPQQGFASPEEAVAAMNTAARADDVSTLADIFGHEYRDVIETSDTAGDKERRREFCASLDEKLELKKLASGSIELIVGKNDYPFPIPLVQKEGLWYFDTDAGVGEILVRRIGRNELSAIDMCREVLDAQYIYADRDWDGDGIKEFAQQIACSKGRYDGLFWDENEEAGVPCSPLHDFAVTHEAYVADRVPGSPWRGYRVKILTAQGARAPGGAKSFMEGDALKLGFAMIAWPAEYEESGIMSFLVSHHGTLYQRDLGEDTSRTASGITKFDPDGNWKPVK